MATKLSFSRNQSAFLYTPLIFNVFIIIISSSSPKIFKKKIILCSIQIQMVIKTMYLASNS
jgi:hypothetical protein